MVREIFHRGSLQELVNQTSIAVSTQRRKFKAAIRRLQGWERRLFDVCVEATVRGDHARATLYANEAANVRNALRLIKQCDLMMERLLIRMATLKELNSAVSELEPVMRALRSLSKQLSGVMPSVSAELERIWGLMDDLLSITSMEMLDAPQPISGPGGEEVLEEARAVAERRLSEKLPAPPREVEVGAPGGATVALLSGGFDSREGDASPDGGDIVDRVFAYARMRGGDVDVKECATELNVPPERVLWALEKLNQEGKVELRR